MINGINSGGNNYSPARNSRIQNSREQFIKKLTDLGIPTDIIQQGPQAVKVYADQNGITLPPPPNGAEKVHHHKHPNRDEIIQFLLSMGIPLDVIQQGPEAVKDYADKHNITLPDPPRPTGQRLNVQG